MPLKVGWKWIGGYFHYSGLLFPCLWPQVLSQPGCMAKRLRNHLCFGHCSSLYVPGVDLAPFVLCNSCVPARRHWTPVFLWCRVGSPASHRRVKTYTVLVERCQCSLKA